MIFAPLSEWRRKFHANDGRPDAALVSDVARLRNETDATDAVAWYSSLVEKAAVAFARGADAEMAIIRAPGRVNLLGTHVDHRGGRVNPIAVRELAMICFPRDDGRVRLANADSGFESHEFAIEELLPDGAVDDWADWTLSTPRALEKAGLLGHWSSYVRACVAYFTNAWGQPAGVRGFDLFVDTQLPKAAGLSSSSALVVGAAYAYHLTNGRNLEPMELAEACGQAEWYVGTRGGAGDQAAIALGRAGQVSHVDFFPMAADCSPWPEGYSVVVCHSRLHAQKTANARSIFNERVATYIIGLLWMKRLHPKWWPKVGHLRDVLRLGLSAGEIYGVLRQLPCRATREQIRAALRDDLTEVEKAFGTHEAPTEGYRVRDVCLYGLAECERSRQLGDYLRAGDIAGVGMLIDLSHEGDRVTCLDEDGRRVPCETGADNDALAGLIAALTSDDPDVRAAADLAQQPGGYACSAPDVDELVDLARGVDGVVGAGLIGAGLGGCVEVIVQDEAVEQLRAVLERDYYRKHHREPFIEVMRPVEGCCALRVG